MKKFLIALNIVIWSLVCFEAAHAAEHAKAPTKPAAKKEVKHHAKVDGTTVSGTKPDTVVAKKKKK
jgi:hypothetical protein